MIRLFLYTTLSIWFFRSYSQSLCDTITYGNGAAFYSDSVDLPSFSVKTIDNDTHPPAPALVSMGVTSNWQTGAEVITPGDTNFFFSATSWFAQPAQADDWLTFGPNTIPASGATLKWKHRYPDNTKRDGYRVLINITGTTLADFLNNSTVLFTVSDNNLTTAGDTVWKLNSVNISGAFTGKQVYIAFHHNANNQFFLLLDDILVEDCLSQLCAGFSTAITSSQPNCGKSNGTAKATTSGGTGPFSFSWSTGAAVDSVGNLAPGTYSVTVTDANGCTRKDSVSLSNTNNPPSAGIAPTNPTCGKNNGSLSANALNGLPPYTYLWTTGSTTNSMSGLSPGNYSLTVTDANGCTGTSSATLTNTGSAPIVTITKSDASCGANNGTAAAAVGSGSPPYSYTWSNGNTSASLSGLATGTYTVTISDANGCSTAKSVTISSSGSLLAAVNPANTNCAASCDGMASVSVSGGTLPYSYSWSNGATGSTVSALCTGNYIVSITDSANCVVIKSFTVSSNSQSILLSTASVNATCYQSNGSAAVNVSGGFTPYSYLWNNSAASTTSSATGLLQGNYAVTVTDNKGCKDSVSVSVGNVGGVTPGITPAQTICAGSSATLNSWGGSVYLWNGGDTSNTITVSPIASTTYSVTVSDSSGCTGTANTFVSVVAKPVTALTAAQDTVCKGSPDLLSASGGTSYYWSTGETTQSIVVYPTAATIYSVVAAIGSCVGTTATKKVNVFLPAPVAEASSDKTTVILIQGGNVNFTSTGSQGNTYQWDFNGDGTIDSFSPSATFTYNASGSFNAILYVAIGNCTASDTIKISVYNVVGMEEKAVRDSGLPGAACDDICQLKIYPNPVNASGHFTLGVVSTNFHPDKIVISNILGQEQKFILSPVAGTGLVDVAMQDTQPGIYFISVFINGRFLQKNHLVVIRSTY